jgi:NAD(P)-dependent dehydrogenase (short-subunit alcohol dehydrogenase family)
LENKLNILITGVSSGIGHALAQHYLNKGHNVLGTVRSENDAMDLAQQANFTKLLVDVSNQASVAKLGIEVGNLLANSNLDVLINNSGIVKAGPLECISNEDMEAQLQVNVLGVHRVTNAVLKYINSGGRIVNMSSVSGLFNSPFTGPYCISKHALESMTDVYRRELSLFGVKVIAIEPGPIKTPIWSKSKGTLDKYMQSRYGGLVNDADKMIDNAERGALDVSEVCKACDKAIFNKNPSTRYIVHKHKSMFKLFTFLPDKWADYLVARTIKGGEKHRMV